MGLDMYLEGRKSVSSRYDLTDDQVKEDGFVVKSHILDLGYWRKHPQLHDFIVDTFAEGVDECQDIFLSKQNVHSIIEAIENDAVYDEVVTGFFFGRSAFPGDADYEDQKARDLKILRAAYEWLNTAPEGEWRDLYYKASW